MVHRNTFKITRSKSQEIGNVIEQEDIVNTYINHTLCNLDLFDYINLIEKDHKISPKLKHQNNRIKHHKLLNPKNTKIQRMLLF